MRNLAGVCRALTLLALALSTLGCDFMLHGPGGAAAAAEKRVGAVLAGMEQEGGAGRGPAIQESMCRWYNGKRFIADRDEAEAAMDGFDRWTKQRRLYGRKISSYRIVESEMIEGAEPETALVTVEIEGKTHQIRVPADGPMSWEGRAPR